jgi:hypothetical protein
MLACRGGQTSFFALNELQSSLTAASGMDVRDVTACRKIIERIGRKKS